MCMIDITPIHCAVYVSATPISIEKFISANQYVKQSACLIDGETAVVAVLTKPIYTQSERSRLIKQIAQDVAEKFSLKSVTVTLDGDVFCKIELQTATVEGIQALLRQREGSYEYIADNRT